MFFVAVAAGVPTAHALPVLDATPSRPHVRVHGDWANVVPCAIPRSGDPGSEVPPRTVSFGCTGSTAYEGDWVGHAVYTATATADFERGVAYGTAEQWFYGTYATDGTSGSMLWRSVFTLDLATGAFHDTSSIVAGTCGFEGSKGKIEFEGLDHAGLVGGMYAGSWTRSPTPAQELCVPGAPPE